MWDVYVKSVDPVIKILHIPTVQSTVIATILDPKSAQLSLTFAIYYAAITALYYDDNNHETIELPDEKTVLLTRYQQAVNRLVVTSDSMAQPNILHLQALAIYVVSITMPTLADA